MTAGPPGVWRLLVPAPCQWISANDGLHWGARDRLATRWRETTHLLLVGLHGPHRPPKGLARVRVDVELHFRDRRPRDAANYHPTVKPVVDALGPPFVRPPSRLRHRGASAPGYGLIPDDTPAHLDGPHVTIGRLWREVAPGPPPRPGSAASFARRRPGGLTVTITDLSHEEAS
jgi:hypothetical protein